MCNHQRNAEQQVSPQQMTMARRTCSISSSRWRWHDGNPGAVAVTLGAARRVTDVVLQVRYHLRNTARRAPAASSSHRIDRSVPTRGRSDQHRADRHSRLGRRQAMRQAARDSWNNGGEEARTNGHAKQLQRGAICALSPTPGSLGRQGELASGRSAECKVASALRSSLPAGVIAGSLPGRSGAALVPREGCSRKAPSPRRSAACHPRRTRPPRPGPGFVGYPNTAPPDAAARLQHTLDFGRYTFSPPVTMSRRAVPGRAGNLPRPASRCPRIDQSSAASGGVPRYPAIRIGPRTSMHPSTSTVRAGQRSPARAARVEALFVWRADNCEQVSVQAVR